MDESALISALSLFAGVSLMPAVFLILRDKEIPLDSDHRMRGVTASLMAYILLALAVLFLLNVLAQDAALLFACIVALVGLPLLLILFDKRRQKSKV